MAKKSTGYAVSEAVEQYEEALAGVSDNHDRFREDIEFGREGIQWDPKIAKARAAEGRPCLTINKLPAFIRQVVNDSRQNKPAIKISPVDGGADVETAEVISSLIRAVERNSNADVAYDTAIDNAVSGGFGFFRIGIDYANEDSFDLEARIERIPNPLSVVWDPSSTRFDAADWGFAFVTDDLTRAEFKARFGDADQVSFDVGDDQTSTGNDTREETIRIAEHWTRSEKKRALILFERPDGSRVSLREDALPQLGRDMLVAGGLDTQAVSDDDAAAVFVALAGLTEIKRREATYFEVKRRILSGADVLREEDWPGSTIPICPVWGEEVFYDGRRHFRSMIRDARDPQAMFNYWRTTTTELVALAPRAPWVLGEQALPNNPTERLKWATANTQNHPYLLYGGGAAPQRQPFSGVPAGALQEAMSASDDIKAITGIYDASLGARSNETSGRAILARQRESDNSNFHFLDNLSRAIQYAGRVLVEIIPSVYGPRETIRIIGDDMADKVVRLTQHSQDVNSAPGPDGGPRLYNLSVGRYDVTVSTGPSYATQREETREVLLELMRTSPDLVKVAADVFLENLDFKDADKIAHRLRALLPQPVQVAEGIAPPPVQQPQPAGTIPGTPQGQAGLPGQPPVQ